MHRTAYTRGSRAARSTGPTHPPVGPLLTAVAGFCHAAMPMGAFTTTWAVELGLSERLAVTSPGLGSGLSVLARVITGFRADRRGHAHLPGSASRVAMGAIAVTVPTDPIHLCLPHTARIEGEHIIYNM